jgi:hypothetical protein
VGVLDFLLKPVYSPASWSRPDAVTGLWWQQPQTPLSQIVIDDIFGDMPEIVDRSAAMKVPAVSRGRALLVGALSDLPLVAYRGDTRIDPQPTWAYRATGVSPWHRMAATIDDLIFYNASLWWRVNGADGFPVDCYHIPFELWQINDQRQIEVRDSVELPWRAVNASDVIYIPGPGTAGLLVDAKDSIRGARAIDRAWVARTRSPIPPTLFVQKEQGDATKEEVSELLTAWANARTNPETAGTAYVPFGIEPMFPSVNDDSQMFIQGRNAVRLDFSNFLNIPASLLDGATATASLTYTTTEGQKSSFHEQSLRYWSAPIEHRLSMDDVVPRGQRVRFDITYTTQVAPTGEPGED